MDFGVFEKLPREELLKLLAILSISDGYISKRRSRDIRLVTKSNSEEQHEFFEYLSKKLFNKGLKRYLNTRICGYNKGTEYLTSILYCVRAVKELLKLSPSFKTSPYKETMGNYLSSPQPTIAFLMNSPEELKWLALRVYFDFDGSIIPSFRLRNRNKMENGKCRVQFECEVRISETNPNLFKELINLCKSLGLNARKSCGKRYWSGLEGIVFSDRESVKRFLEFGGPITNVKVAKGKRFIGIPKKVLCDTVKTILNERPFLFSRSFKDKEKAELYRDECRNKLKEIIQNSKINFETFKCHVK